MNDDVDGLADNPMSIFYQKNVLPVSTNEIASLVSFKEIYNFIHTLFRRAQVEPECLIAGVVYLEHFLSKCPNIHFTLHTWKRLVFVAIMVASKAWDDISCSTRSFVRCSDNQFTKSELSQMELLFLTQLDFRLYLSSTDYRNAYYDLKKIWVNLKINDDVCLLVMSLSIIISINFTNKVVNHSSRLEYCA